MSLLWTDLFFDKGRNISELFLSFAANISKVHTVYKNLIILFWEWIHKCLLSLVFPCRNTSPHSPILLLSLRYTASWGVHKFNTGDIVQVRCSSSVHRHWKIKDGCMTAKIAKQGLLHHSRNLQGHWLMSCMDFVSPDQHIAVPLFLGNMSWREFLDRNWDEKLKVRCDILH